MDYELIKPDEQDAYDPAPFLSYARLRKQDKEERDAGVADVVHYWTNSHHGCRAAIVTEVHLAVDEGYSSAEDLWVLPNSATYDGQPMLAKLVVHNESKPEATSGHELHNGTWHWPCGGQ
jgi:hypothetical protein